VPEVPVVVVSCVVTVVLPSEELVVVVVVVVVCPCASETGNAAVASTPRQRFKKLVLLSRAGVLRRVDIFVLLGRKKARRRRAFLIDRP
jgi:hypothetical protein